MEIQIIADSCCDLTPTLRRVLRVRRSRLIIWPKRRSAMPSAQLHTAAATTTGTERGRGQKLRKETGRGGCPFRFFCCVQAVPPVVRRPKRRFSGRAVRSRSAAVGVTGHVSEYWFT